MGGSKPPLPSPPSTRSQVAIPELYRRCLIQERNAAKLDFDKLKVTSAKARFFGRALFEPPPVMDERSAIDKPVDVKIRRQLWEAGKYRDILKLLRKATTPDARLFLLAWWLSQEKVCEPEDIVGIAAFRRLAKKTFRCLSPNAFHHAARVRIWLPYFERLLQDFRTKKAIVSELVKQGYDEAAVRAARRKRSAISAACDWLAVRDSAVDAPNLRNAYSAVYGRRRQGRFHG